MLSTPNQSEFVWFGVAAGLGGFFGVVKNPGSPPTNHKQFANNLSDFPVVRSTLALR